MAWHRWTPYVPVAQRRQQAARKMQALRKKGIDVQPVEIEGRTIARTFWGKAWCKNLDSFSDYENRLPRGRTYVRNGSVCHLGVARGTVDAKVYGSNLYDLSVTIKTLPAARWKAFKRRCRGEIGSLLELLQGRLSDQIMTVVTDRKHGLFPRREEIGFNCNCPDWADMCKHVAAVLYGVGARLDESPELLFLLRGVDHEELIETDAGAIASVTRKKGRSKRLASDDLSEVFGIALDAKPEEAASPTTRRKTTKGASSRGTKSTNGKAKPGTSKASSSKGSQPKSKSAPKSKTIDRSATKKTKRKKKATPRTTIKTDVVTSRASKKRSTKRAAAGTALAGKSAPSSRS